MAGLEMKYFVLNPGKDNDYGRASRAAIRRYAAEMIGTNDELAAELQHWMVHLECRIDIAKHKEAE